MPRGTYSSGAGARGVRSGAALHLQLPAVKLARPPMETAFDRFVRAARTGLFGVLLTMAKDSHSARAWSLFGMAFDFLQLLGYALYSGRFFPWCVGGQ